MRQSEANVCFVVRFCFNELRLNHVDASIGLQINGSHAFTLYHCYSSLNLFFILDGPVNWVQLTKCNWNVALSSVTINKYICSVGLVYSSLLCQGAFWQFRFFFLRKNFNLLFLLLSLCVIHCACMRFAFGYVVCIVSSVGRNEPVFWVIILLLCMSIGSFSGILIECTTWTTRKFGSIKREQSESNLPHAQKSVCVGWNDCLFAPIFHRRFVSCDFDFLCHINLHFTPCLSPSLPLFLIFFPFLSFAPNFTLLFHHINIFQSQNTHTRTHHTRTLYRKNIDSLIERERERESVWHWR